MLPMPHTMAGSSKPARSPCSSTNLSVMFSAMSRKVGLQGQQAVGDVQGNDQEGSPVAAASSGAR